MTARPSPKVAAAFNSYDEPVRDRLLELRKLILETADDTAGVGPIEEALRWGQPSYLTTKSRSGSTIRVAPAGTDSAYDFGMYLICNTNLVETFTSLFGDTFVYDGERALLFSTEDKLPVDELQACIAMALTYHLDKG